MALDDPSTECQSDSRASVFVTGVKALEYFEDAVVVGGLDTLAADSNDLLFPISFGRDVLS